MTERSVRRTPSDVVHLVVAVLLVGGCAVVTDGFTAGVDDVYTWLSELPSWLGTMSTWLFVACTLGAVGVVVLALLVTRNFRLALTLVGVGVLTVLVSIVLADVIDVDAIREAAGGQAASLSADAVVWLAAATSLLRTAAPYLVRPARRSVGGVQVLAIVGAVFAAVAPIGAILAAVGVGWAVSAIANLVVGTPSATPSSRSVLDALSDLGISIDQLTIAGEQTWGETRFLGRAPDGSAVSIVVIGRDAADARLVSKLWRAVLYRDAGRSVSVSRSAQLEHRAYMLLMAAKAGVSVSEVVIAATAGRDDLAMLVLLDPDGTPLAEHGADSVSDATLDDAWETVGRLHDARLTHGQLGPANVLIAADGSTALVDFSLGSAGAPQERCVRDRVDLLAVTAALVDDTRALDAAARSIGRDGIGELLPMLETAALSPSARRALPDARKRLKALREAGAGLAGIEVPKLTQLRRVSVGSLVMAAATFLGFYLIVAQFVGIDIRATLSEADVGWVLVAAAVSFVPQFSGSIALMGCVGKPLPFGPVLAEQFANNFTGLIGGTVATTALVIRFFQKQGLKVAIAASSAIMNSLAGAIVQIVLIVIALIFTSTSFVPSSMGGGGDGAILLVGVIVIGVAVTAALLVPKLRATLRRKVKPQLGAARENLRAILSNPRNALMVFGGNLTSQLAFALVISAALRAYGESLPLLDIVLINSFASFVGGMAPVPGGMGVVEAGLIAGMTAAGVPQAEAVAATFTARLFTTYLSPIWGWVALGWLRRHDFV